MLTSYRFHVSVNEKNPTSVQYDLSNREFAFGFRDHCDR